MASQVSKPASSGKIVSAAPGGRKTVVQQSSKPIRFPTARTETGVRLTSGAKIHSPDVSVGVSHSTKARVKQSSGSTSSRKTQSSAVPAYRLPRDEQSGAQGSKRLELQGRGLSVIASVSPRQGSSKSSASWKPSSVRVEGGKITYSTTRPTAQPHGTRDGGEERKLGAPQQQHYTPHHRDVETGGTNAGVYQYGGHPKPLHSTSKSDQDL